MKHDLNELKALVNEFGAVFKKGHELLCKIYLYTHQWVNEAIRNGVVKTRADGIQAISKTVGRAYNTVQNWESCGAKMEEHSIGIGADPRAVRILAAYYGSTPTDARLKMISQIKKGADYAVIYREWKANPDLMRNETHRRLARLQKEGRLTKQYLKVEMLALLTASRKVFAKDNLSICIADEDFTPLLEVGNKLTLA